MTAAIPGSADFHDRAVAFVAYSTMELWVDFWRPLDPFSIVTAGAAVGAMEIWTVICEGMQMKGKQTGPRESRRYDQAALWTEL